MLKMEKKFIDIDKIVAERAKNLPRFLQKMIAAYLKRIAHQDEVNDALYRYRNRFENDFADAAFEEFNPELEVVGLENVPTTGGCIIAANHPLGGLDGIAMMHIVGGEKRGIRKDIRFIVNDLLLHLKNFGSIFIPVNKLGKNSTDYLQKVEALYSSEHCILVFPAGLCSRKQAGGVIRDLKWNKSFITKAVKYQKDIIPCYIEGRNSNFFYNLARLRNFLGIKFNIEMMYLADEMYRQRGKKLKYVFGKPIPWQTFDKSKNDNAWAEEVKKIVYALGE
jgi:putative hemolysin